MKTEIVKVGKQGVTLFYLQEAPFKYKKPDRLKVNA